MGTRCICRCVPTTSLQAPNINATRKSRTTVQLGHLTAARDMRPLAKTNTLASVIRNMHCPKPYSYHRAAAPIIVADSCHQTAHMHILCDITTHHSQQTTANCPQHQGCVAAVAVSQPFVSRAPRSVHLCKQKWGIACTMLQA